MSSEPSSSASGLSPEHLRLLALLMEEEGVETGAAQPISRRGGEGDPPLSFAQQRLWLLDRMEPGDPAYNVPAGMRLHGALDVRALERALGEVVRRHESLRTVFAERGGEPVQTVRPSAPVPLPVLDLRGRPEPAREAELRRIAAEEGARPFDLAEGPLLRAQAVRLADAEWVLLFTLHHVVSDAWSVRVLVREVSEAYAAFAAGRRPSLPELPVQYADYAVWQRGWLAGERLEAQLGYWRERLAGAPPVLDLPTDRPRAPDAGRAADRRGFHLAPGATEALRGLARGEGATLFAVLLAGFQALLGRWASQDDVLVGTPVAGRTRVELEGLIGFFVNTLVVRADLSDGPTARALVARAREAVLEAQSNQDLPFERLVEELKTERSLTHTPLFQVLFTLDDDAADGALRLGDAELEPLDRDSGTAPFDLGLVVADGGASLSGWMEFRTALFDGETVERMLEHYVRVLEGMAAAPDRPVREIPLLTGDERRRLLEEWGAAGGSGHPRDRLAHELFAGHAARAPDAPALLWGGEVVSYAELDRRAAALAARLRALGVAPEVRVAVCAERSPELPAALLAVFRAGGVYVPLDPSYPAERLRYVLADAGASVLVTQERLLGRLPEFGGKVVLMDGEHDGATGEAAVAGCPLSPVPCPLNLAYVIYTSGSTGRPKGVAATHGNLLETLLAARERFGFGAGDVMPALASSAFDISLFETLGPLVSGAAVRLVPRDRVADVEALAEETEGATLLHAVPALMRQAVRAVAERGGRPGMRAVFVGGEAVPPDLLPEMRAAFPSAALHVLYGPTEATVICASHGAGNGAPGPQHPIGRELGGARLYVCDAVGDLLPPGIPGELFVGGGGVARGYLGRPRLTAERYVPDPFSGRPGARLYRTGDRARRRADGTLEFLGRTDAQVKVRGFRIEPGEIEAALAAHPEVAEAVVVAREDAPGDRRLVGYVVAANGAPAPLAELRAHLHERLPEHMVPGALVALETLPLTPTGKIDRRALPAPGGGAADGPYRAPRTPTEEVLAGVWADVLGVERVGVDDGFFDLGGHSLLGTRVVSRVREALGVELPLRALFEAPTVAGIAERVEAALREGREEQAPPVVRVPRDRPLPLSFSQERLWFLDRLEPVNAHYNIFSALRLRGALDAGALGRAVAATVRRHEALRTVFAAVDGEAVQVVAPPGAFPLPVVDLSARPEGEREAETLRLAREEAGGPFDLERGPLFRVRFLRLGAEEHVLLLTLHHVVGDAWSAGVLQREVSLLYAAELRGEPSPLPPLPVQYADYAVWQRDRLRGEELERQLAWWRGRLAGAPPLLDLPVDRPRPPVQTHRAGEHAFTLPAALADALRETSRREGVTLFMSLLAGFQLLLSVWSGEENVVVGTPIAGRTRAETEGLIGFFVNMLALRTDLSGDPSFSELLRRVRETTLGAYAHQDVPFEKLLEELKTERSLAHASVYQSMLVLHNAGSDPLALPGVEVSPVPVGSSSAVMDLEVAITDAPGGLAGSVVYAADLFDESTVARMVDGFRLLLEQAVADPSRPLSRFALVAGAGPRVLPAERPLPPEPLAHRLFEARADRAPDAVAVVSAGETLTYAELERRANRLANHLRGRGVGPEDRVAVCLERATEMLVAVLGVLKAGAAYVPLDPATPRDRLAWAVADSGASVLLTQERLRPLLPADGPEVLALDGDGGPLARACEERPRVAVAPENAAYVIYTSGSTGRPKGVVVPHGALANYAEAAREGYGIGAGDRVLQFASLSFDASAEEIYPALSGGAALVLRTEEMLRSVSSFMEACASAGVTVLDLPTAFWHEVAAELERGTVELPACVRLVIIGGERALPERVAAWRGRVGDGVRLVNTYGPTETTIVATAAELTGQGMDAAAPVPIGRPVANARTYVLDARMRLLPRGVRGELCVGGAGVARGYLDRPDLTAEKFVPDPFSPTPGARVYRTGDLVRLRRDEMLEFVGRTDFQVKVRGFRVEPGEVEAALVRHPALREAVVVAREDEPGRTRLVAYVVPGPKEEEPTAGAPAGPLADARLHDLFAAQVARTPDAVALLAGAETLTYAELDRRADALAVRLRERGVGPEVRVGVSLEWGPELVVALLATLKAGGVYLPLDPAYPAERRAFMAADAGARVRVTDGGVEGLGGEVGMDAEATPDNLAYVVYTSGSTGTPKGVAVEHRAAAAHLRVMARALGIGPADRVLQFASASFDVSLEQVLLPLLHGAALVLRGPEPWAPGEWAARAEALGVTVANLPPAFWRTAVEEGAGAPRGLRLLVVGGDVLPPRVVPRWRREGGAGVRLVNAYGPTETVVTATLYEVPEGFPGGFAGSAAPVGVPLPGRAAHLLDAAGEPVPPGDEGELYLGGLVARGYPGRPDLTAERFVPDPFGAEPGARLYRTGDRARRLPGGDLEFLGRVDRQVKVRGFRIEPGEVEAALEAHPAVREAAVVAREDGPGGARLVAYVRGDALPGAEELRAWLRGRLPEHMVPGRVVALADLPRTPSGKTDRRALPAPDAEPGEPGAAPRTPTEEALAAIWAELLGVPAVGAHDDFLALGGHSLAAGQVVSRVRSALGVDLPLRAVFDAPTVAALAGRIDAARGGGAGEGIPLAPRAREGTVPLSFAQQRLWFIDRLDPGSPVYNLPAGLRLRGPLDVRALRRTLEEVVRRHESLRTIFAEAGGEPRQVVLPAAPVPLPVVELGALPPEARERELRRLAAGEAARPFDLERGPLLRGALLRIGEGDAALLFTLHHVASDGWSMGVLTREVSALYAAFAAGRPSPLPPLPVQYADYALWQRERLSGDAAEAEVRWWRRALAGAPAALRLPADGERPDAPGDRGGSLALRLDAGTVERLRELSRREGATLFMTLLAAFGALLARWSGQTDVVVGTPIAGRTREELEGLIGFFVNTLAVRADLSGDPGFRDLVGRVRETALGAFAHQEIPFERLVEELGVARAPGRNPLFQAMFALQTDAREGLALGAVAAEPLEQPAGHVPFDLSLAMVDAGEGAHGLLSYRSDLLREETARRMLDHFAAILAQVAADPDVRLSRLELPGIPAPAPEEPAAAPARVDAGELRAWLKGMLPEYMVPSAWVVLDRLPLTPGGKVDRRALPAPPDGSAAAEHVPPRTPTERALAAVWAEVLRVEQVGAHDEFFALGGHSLLATRLVARVRDRFGVELPLRALFEAPTLAGTAERIDALLASQYLLPQPAPSPGPEPTTSPHPSEQAMTATPADLLASLSPERRILLQRAMARKGEDARRVRPRRGDGPVPLSYAQQRLWLVDRMEPGTFAYNMATALRLRGRVEPRVLRRTLSEVVRRHEALRTVFAEGADGPVQVVLPPRSFRLPVVELAGLPAGARETEVLRLRDEEVTRPFDLARGPLLRGTLVRLNEEESAVFFVMHHIVSDGWSMGILVNEISTLYSAFAEGRPSPFPELPVQYPDFAVWQRAWLSGDALEGQLAYWRRRMADAPPVLDLPVDRPRPPSLSMVGDGLLYSLPPGISVELRELARREGVTVFMLLLAAFQVTLARWAGQEDVVVGTPTAGRTHTELEGLIGFFINTLVLRTDLSGDPTLRGLLVRARETVLGAQANQDIPFERVVEDLSPERSLQHTPLFQVLFAVQPGRDEELKLGAVEMESMGAEMQVAKFDLSLDLYDTSIGIWGSLSFRPALWDRATMERLLEHYTAVLHALVADPDRRLSSVALASGEETRLLLEEWSVSGNDSAPRRCVHELFAEQAARTPDAVALVSGGERVTYAELDRRSDALAHVLAARGVGPDVRVGVLAERSPGMVAGLLGILKAGGAYVPLDPGYPAERLAYMLADSAVPVLLAQERLLERVPEFGGKVVLLDGEAPGDARGAPKVRVTPDHLAYVIYTSGSTGQPKGTEVPHRAIPGFFWDVEYARFDERTVLLQHSSTSWDALTLELWPALLKGGTCVLLPAQTSEPALLGEQVREHGVTATWISSAYFNSIVDTTPEVLAGLRLAMIGGEAVSVPHVRRALEAYPELRIVNGYGPSECTVFTSCYPIPADFDAAAIPIGRPVGDRRVYLLDRYSGAVPLGVAGELCVGGPSVARGYLGRPELTAERFVPDPFSGEPGARMYRSGDRVKWRADGLLEFVGRVDFQVKVRGFRVEPGEVEAVLASHPRVREAAVVVRADTAGAKALVGYAVAPEDTGAELRGWLRERMPEHMVPSAVVVLEAMPLTPHGKVDRRALPAPGAAGDDESYVAPRTPTEELLAGIWAAVLGVERVGAGDGFFDRGGHSLLATRVVSRVREAFGAELPLRAVFEAPTLAALAERVDTAVREGRGTDAPPIVRVPRDRPLPLSFAQQRLWLIDQLEPGTAVYNIPTALRVRGALDAGVLRRALAEVVRRHEPLRTVFAKTDGRAVQVILPPGAAGLPEVDLRGLAPEHREALLRRLADEEAVRPFDLARGPLLRASVVRTGDGERGVLLNMHHVVSDAWSMDVLVREVTALYEAFAAGRPSPLPELRVQYADFAAWQREWLEGETLERQLAWWRERLAGAPPTVDLPTDRPRPRVAGPEGSGRPFVLPPDATAALRALARREGATVFMAAMAGWQALQARYAGQEDVSAGTPIAGRNRIELEGLIGFFVNTLVVRTDLGGRPGARELLRRVRESTLGAYAHQDLPFERLVEELGTERSLAYTPIFQSVLSVQSAGSGGAPVLRLGEAEVEPIESASGTAKFDLSFGLTDHGEVLAGALAYRTELWDPSTIDRMLEHFALLLGGMAADPDRPVAGLPLLPEAERRQVLEGWNGEAARNYPAALTHELIAAQARRTPEAVAVSHRGRALTYAELDRRANRLARYLRGLGVGPETRVGVSLPRTPELVVALVAVLRAGGAYVPLDPAYPRERLGWMLEDAGARLVLTVSGLAGRLPACAEPLLLDELAGRIDAESDAAPDAGVGPESLSHVIFTSGSTGRPKGVMIRHRSASVLVHWLREHVSDEERSAVLFSTSVNFDVSVAEVFGTLCWGGKLVLAESALELATLGEPVVHASMVPTAAAELLRSGGIPAGVRTLNLGGEPLPSELAQALYALGTVEKVGNLYGPTEDTTYSTYSVVERGGTQVFVGRPVANTRAYVLDAELQPVPAGVVGELYLAGDGLARGYANRPDLTAERFLPDPFGAPGGRMYRVMDRVRWRADGVLEYFGRTDFQVKVRGFRIELGEIETVLAGHPAVRETVAVVREDTPGDRRIVAYLVAREGAEAPAAGELRALARERLPEHMVPSAFVVLERLPLTPNGKLDRRALPVPGERPEQERAYLAPRTPTEGAVARIWAEVLGLDRVGVHDNFFELGGHSLLLVQLHSRLQERFGAGLSLADLFGFPTLGDLARRLEGSAEAAAKGEEARDESVERAEARRARMVRRRPPRPGAAPAGDDSDDSDD